MGRPGIGTRFSEEEFLALPTSHDHVELIDGEVVLAPSPRRVHQDLVLRLATLLTTWAAAHPPAWVGLSPLDVRLAPGRIVQPDLFVLAAGPPPGERPLDVVPDLVIEVLSENRSYDRITKKLLYSEAGVREYWLVDPEDETVEIVEGLRAVEVTRALARSRQLPDLSVDLTALFDLTD